MPYLIVHTFLLYRPSGTKSVTWSIDKDGGVLGNEVDVPLIMPSSRTARIQEMHILILHIWCEMLDAA